MRFFIPGYIVTVTQMSGQGRKLWDAYLASQQSVSEQGQRQAKLALSEWFRTRCGERDVIAAEFLEKSANGVFALRSLGVVLQSKERRTDAYHEAIHWK